jgi:hypothetical protein
MDTVTYFWRKILFRKLGWNYHDTSFTRDEENKLPGTNCISIKKFIFLGGDREQSDIRSPMVHSYFYRKCLRSFFLFVRILQWGCYLLSKEEASRVKVVLDLNRHLLEFLYHDVNSDPRQRNPLYQTFILILSAYMRTVSVKMYAVCTK